VPAIAPSSKGDKIRESTTEHIEFQPGDVVGAAPGLRGKGRQNRGGPCDPPLPRLRRRRSIARLHRLPLQRCPTHGGDAPLITRASTNMAFMQAATSQAPKSSAGAAASAAEPARLWVADRRILRSDAPQILSRHEARRRRAITLLWKWY
jgi:hypothetical protein